MSCHSPHHQPHPGGGPAIYLDYGADGEECNDREIRICERGMCFRSRWQFEIGTELAIALTYHDGGESPKRADLQGIIAACEKICRCCHEVTMVFIDLPDEMRPVIAEIAAEIASRLEAGGMALPS
jgi:hypothetical protein